MSRAHVVIQPSRDSIDMDRREYGASGIWLAAPKPAWIATLLPRALNEADGGSDLTFSTFRRFPLIDPQNFTLSSETDCLTRILLPIGAGFDPSLWCSLWYHSPRETPFAGTERFHVGRGRGGGTIKRILSETLERPEFIELYAQAQRPGKDRDLGSLGLDGAGNRAWLR